MAKWLFGDGKALAEVIAGISALFIYSLIYCQISDIFIMRINLIEIKSIVFYRVNTHAAVMHTEM